MSLTGRAPFATKATQNLRTTCATLISSSRGILLWYQAYPATFDSDPVDAYARLAYQLEDIFTVDALQFSHQYLGI